MLSISCVVFKPSAVLTLVVGEARQGNTLRRQINWHFFFVLRTRIISPLVRQDELR